MSERELKSEILKRLKNGLSKNDIYQEYNQSVEDTLLRRILASRPSNSVKSKYRIMHRIICWIWIMFFTIEFLGLADLIIAFDLKVLLSLVISFYILIQLWRFNGDIYLPAILWLIWGIVNTIKDMIYLSKDDVDYEFIMGFCLGYIIIFLVTIFMMCMVRKKVFSHYHWFKPIIDHENKIVFQKD